MQEAGDTHLFKIVSVDWAAGIQGMAVALCLAGISARSHTTLPLYGATAIALYALVVPLRLKALVLSRWFPLFVLQLGVRAGAIAAAAYILSLAINSGLPPLAVLGNVLFLALLTLVAVVGLRAGGHRALRSIAALATVSGSALTKVRWQIGLVTLYFPRLPGPATQTELPSGRDFPSPR
jgi:hypothetical protein